MQLTQYAHHIKIESESRFSAAQTFGCGQCFRWRARPDGSFTGIVRGTIARVWDEDGALCISGTQETFDTLWRAYFDCDTDYTAICRAFAVDDFTAAAARFGAGIRILRQEPWEALCTFLLSQCNNIPRITALVQRLCTGWGEPIADSGEFAFPAPDALADLTPDALAPLRAGYRAPYLIGAAQAFRDPRALTDLQALSTEEARREIMRLHGVGRKVADCFLLFGLHKLDAFPVDTWMKKAAAYYSGDIGRFMHSPYAGVFQQYFFHYTRNCLGQSGSL